MEGQVYNSLLSTTKLSKILQIRQYISSISVCIGAICAGTTLAWSSPVLPQLNPTANEAGLIGGMVPFGALLAAVPAGYLSDKYGRKTVLISIGVLYLINWLLIMVSDGEPYWIIFGRVFAGLATGTTCVVVPMYIGEIAHKDIRGILTTFFQIFLCLGLLLTCSIGAITNWLFLSISLAVLPLIYLIGVVFVKESPSYLLKIGDINRAKSTLIYFQGSDTDLKLEPTNQLEHIKITQSLYENRKGLIAMIGIMMFQQLSGINAVVFYTVPIFTTFQTNWPPDLPGIIIALVQLIASYLMMLIIEKTYRRYYLFSSSIGMSITLLILGLYYHLDSLNYVIILNVVPLISAILFMICFSMGYGPIPWILIGELFTGDIKGVASGFAIFTNWLFAFLVTFLFPILNENYGIHYSFYGFSILMVIATGFVYFYVPETKGKSLQEIQNILKG